jgi:hypothetical protein
MKTKQETLELIENSVSSIFSKEDVIKLINDLQADQEQDKTELIDKIITEIKDDEPRMWNDYNTEYRIEGSNEIVIDTIDFNWDYIEECIEKVINK